MTKQEAIAKLESSRELLTEEEFNDFEQAQEVILQDEDINDIIHLCKGFDDYTDQHGVTFSLIHVVESYYKLGDTKQVAAVFARAFANEFDRAPEWITTLNTRLLNNANICQAYVQAVLECDDEVRNVIIDIMEQIEMGDNSDLQKKAQAVIDQIM